MGSGVWQPAPNAESPETEQCGTRQVTKLLWASFPWCQIRLFWLSTAVPKNPNSVSLNNPNCIMFMNSDGAQQGWLVFVPHVWGLSWEESNGYRWFHVWGLEWPRVSLLFCLTQYWVHLELPASAPTCGYSMWLGLLTAGWLGSKKECWRWACQAKGSHMAYKSIPWDSHSIIFDIIY